MTDLAVSALIRKSFKRKFRIFIISGSDFIINIIQVLYE